MTQTAREISHDLANALGGILVGAELGERRAQPGAERDAFATIAAGARRAAELVKSLTPLLPASFDRSQHAVERDEAYVEHLSPALPSLLARTKSDCERDGVPLLDLASARCLSVLVSLAKPKAILELGTANGYSALWMALAQEKSATIVTVEPDVARAATARSLFREAGVEERIGIVERPALEVLASMKGRRFDLLFIDAVKTEYSEYLDAALPLVNSGGLVIADNLLWSSRSSLEPRPDDDPPTAALRHFNAKFLSHSSLRAVILPVGDGLGVGVKTG